MAWLALFSAAPAGADLPLSPTPAEKLAAQACEARLMKVPGAPQTYNHRREVRSLCENKQPDLGWQDCMAAQMARGGWLLKKPTDAYYSCDPRYEIADFPKCVGDYLSRPGVPEMFPAFELCQLPPSGRACVEDAMKAGLRGADAKRECSYRSRPTRVCMRSFYKKEGVFTRKWPGQDEPLIHGEYEADIYCKASNRDTRACYLDVMLKFKWDMDEASKFCDVGPRLGGSPNPYTKEGQDCVKLLTEEMPDPSVRIRAVDAAYVCTLSNFEMRACVFDRITTGFWKRYSPIYEFQCLSDFMKNLENPMQGLAHDIGCRFKE